MLDTIKHAVDWIFGQTNEQQVDKLRGYLEEVNSYSKEYRNYSDPELQSKTEEFKERLQQGTPLPQLLPESFAVVREVADRTVGLRPYDVQILGGVALFQGRIAEMQTGEGKTLVATMPAYLKSLREQVHIATVNDYLAQRDRDWMGPIYESLGLEVSALQEDMEAEQRKQAYEADIVYGTASQFGFDYLRDHMVVNKEKQVQPDRYYAILDEIDSTLIDEARTPLIISGSAEESTRLYKRFSRLAPRFNKNQHYEVDEKNQQITLTDRGANRAEELLHVDDIYDPQHLDSLEHLKLALKAECLFSKDEDYIIKDGSVVIVDEFTGRLMPDRRYSGGLHQALEAKEGMLIQQENQTLAQITLQNYFLLYDDLAGMTGTAKTEEEEFQEIYGMDVVVIPTNVPLQRDHKSDVIYKTKETKFNAIADKVEELHDEGRPVLVGTNAIEKSEKLSELLSKRGLDHEVLNAKHHAREAEIIKQAGQTGAITIATNMAGRGTDIKLEEGVADLGGLHVIGAQRHESRRIDNQLRGRAGRQGDRGSSQFYLSLEDDLLRIFGGDQITSIMDRVGVEDGQPIEHSLLTQSIRRAQKKVEGRNFEMRKQVLKYDEVMAKQREAVYDFREQFLPSESEQGSWQEIDQYLQGVFEDYSQDLIDSFCPQNSKPDQWNLDDLKEELVQFENGDFESGILTTNRQENKEIIRDFLEVNWNRQREQFQELSDFPPNALKTLILKVIDNNWRQHLYVIDDLKQGIGWSSYGGKDPLVEFKQESFRLFQEMLAKIREEIVESLVKREISISSAPEEATPQIDQTTLNFQHDSQLGSVDEDSGTSSQQSASQTNSKSSNPQQRIVEDEPGRNDPCPCGSGKKYKHCCGR